MATTSTSPSVKEVDPKTLHGWLHSGQALVVDVRPPEMFATERIPGALSLPLASVHRSSFPELGGRKLVFQCEVGMASQQASEKILGEGWRGDVYNLPGGLRAWKRAGLEVEGNGAGASVSIPRQVQIAAGSLVVVGVVLGVLASPWFLLLAGAVGAGLVFSGASGTCAMAAVLGRLPFNR